MLGTFLVSQKYINNKDIGSAYGGVCVFDQGSRVCKTNQLRLFKYLKSCAIKLSDIGKALNPAWKVRKSIKKTSKVNNM